MKFEISSVIIQLAKENGVAFLPLSQMVIKNGEIGLYKEKYNIQIEVVWSSAMSLLRRLTVTLMTAVNAMHNQIFLLFLNYSLSLY